MIEQKTFKDLEIGDKFRFMYDSENTIRTVVQIGKREIYCPTQFSNEFDEKEVYLKSKTPIVLLNSN